MQDTLGAGADVDHFAPRFLVGNALSGAPATSQTGYFRYIPDPGDGTGIAQALAEMAALAVPCDLCLGLGTYTRATGLARFVVPGNCRVWSPGGALILSNDADVCIFELGPGCSLERLALVTGIPSAVGSALVEVPAGQAVFKVLLRDLFLSITNMNKRAVQVVGGDVEIASSRFLYTPGQEVTPIGISVEGRAGQPGTADIHDCDLTLFNAAIRLGAAVSVRDSRIANNRFTSSAGQVPIAAGAFSSNCLAMGNVSRGSGATLPTDAGAGNSINPGVANIWGA